MSQKPLVFVLMIAGLVVAWFALSPSQQPLHAQDGQTHQHVAVGNPWAEGDAFARGLAAGMDRMHRDMMAPSPTGNADIDFLATMIPHHEGAVEMARLALIHGSDPLVRQLAEEIIAGQQVEIAAMQARLQILRRGANPQPDGYPALGSARGR